MIGLVVAMAAIDSFYRIVRFDTFRAGTDVALFDQAVWHYSRFEAPISSIKGFNLLGDHFHPLVAALAPLYWIWSDPRMLFIAGSILVALSVIPVFIFARDRLPETAAYLIALGYGAFFGIQMGVGFEFHEVEFAPLLIALSMLFADRRQWGRLYVTLALLLLVKEDLSLVVAFFGLYLLTVRELARGAVIGAAGLLWYVLATEVAIPHFAPGGFSYWTYTEIGDDLPDALQTLVTAPWKYAEVFFSTGQKVETLGYLLLPFLLLSLWSRWFLLAIPLLLSRFLSTRADLWSNEFHHSLALAPILAMSATAALAKLKTRQTVLAGVICVLCIATTVTIPGSPPRLLVYPSFYKDPPWAAAAERAIEDIPDDAPVTAEARLLTRLTQRDAAYLAVGAPPGYVVIGR